MKRILFFLFAMMSLFTARAQYTMFPKFSDNWSVSVGGGVSHPLVYQPEVKLLTPSMGVGLKKQLTPVFALGMDCDYISWNNRLSMTRYERLQTHLVGSFNLCNVFGAYPGTPRLFDVEAKASAGWGHIFNRSYRRSPDANYLVTKCGLDVTCNFGANRRWGVSLRPNVRFDLRNEGKPNYESFSTERAEFDFSLALVYRIGAKARPSIFEPPVTVSANQHEDLLEAVRFLHKDLAERDATIAKQEQRIAQLEGKVATHASVNAPTKSTAPTTSTTSAPSKVSNNVASRQLELMISFGNGRAVVDASQFISVERVAKYLNKNPKARVEVKGYATPGGKLSANIRIAQQRAEAVQNLLIAQYGISKNRIVATGQGVGRLFAEPEWNSVAVCTIIE